MWAISCECSVARFSISGPLLTLRTCYFRHCRLAALNRPDRSHKGMQGGGVTIVDSF
jgi:hypothetical protein